MYHDITSLRLVWDPVSGTLQSCICYGFIVYLGPVNCVQFHVCFVDTCYWNLDVILA